MVDRQEIIANNKSLRLIKNELEHLLDKGVITDHVFDSIHSLLPTESSLSGAPTPAAAVPTTVNSAMANLAINPPSPAPPAYKATGPPALPSRNTPSQPPPPPPPSKPVIARARALYAYQAADQRDLSFERDDSIAVHEYMNDDWWMGRNERTGAEGIFPKTYVQVDSEKAGGNSYYGQQPTYASPQSTGMGGYPPPPKQQNPYDSSVPPMSVANHSGGGGGVGEAQQPSKASQNGKKFGKKLGNAAIFGAGATLGGNLVNSIF